MCVFMFPGVFSPCMWVFGVWKVHPCSVLLALAVCCIRLISPCILAISPHRIHSHRFVLSLYFLISRVFPRTGMPLYINPYDLFRPLGLDCIAWSLFFLYMYFWFWWGIFLICTCFCTYFMGDVGNSCFSCFAALCISPRALCVGLFREGFEIVSARWTSVICFRFWVVVVFSWVGVFRFILRVCGDMYDSSFPPAVVKLSTPCSASYPVKFFRLRALLCAACICVSRNCRIRLFRLMSFCPWVYVIVGNPPSFFLFVKVSYVTLVWWFYRQVFVFCLGDVVLSFFSHLVMADCLSVRYCLCRVGLFLLGAS